MVVCKRQYSSLSANVARGTQQNSKTLSGMYETTAYVLKGTSTSTVRDGATPVAEDATRGFSLGSPLR
eukprot:scaffold164227_cov34-Prasinocladus_malaysianus.AAC.1